MFFLSDSGCNCNIVVETKASNDIVVSVMTGRTDDGKGLIDLHLGTDSCYSFDSAATRDKRSLGRVLVHVRVNTLESVLLVFETRSVVLNVPDMIRFVRKQKISFFCLAGVKFNELGE